MVVGCGPHLGAHEPRKCIRHHVGGVRRPHEPSGEARQLDGVLCVEPQEPVVEFDHRVCVVTGSPNGYALTTFTAVDDDTTALVAELELLEQRRNGLAEAYAAGEIDRAQLAAGTAALDVKRDTVRAGTAETSASADPIDVDELRRLWETGEVEWTNRVAASILESVVVHPAVVGRNYFDPGRLEVRWRR